MTRDVAVALALRATHVAMAAKCGEVTERHRLYLLQDVLAFAARDPGWVAAVLAFEASVWADPKGAGALLHEFVLGPGQPETTAKRVEATLGGIAAEPTDHFSWMDRKDING